MQAGEDGAREMLVPKIGWTHFTASGGVMHKVQTKEFSAEVKVASTPKKARIRND